VTEAPKAFFVPDGTAFVPTDASLGPWGPGLLHGGPIAALCATLLEQQTNGELLSVRLTTEYLRPPTQTPLEPKTREVRSGRRAEVREIELSSHGKLVARASLLQLRPVELQVPDSLRADPQTAPDSPDDYSAPTMPTNRTPAQIVGLGVEMRVKGNRTLPGTGAVWMRHLIPIIPDTPSSSMARVALCGDFGNGMSGPPSEAWPPPVAFPNADLDIRLLRATKEEWIRIDARSAWSENGVGITRTELQDTEGLLAVAQQSLALQPS
jgi:acyl-CoA thioesterase